MNGSVRITINGKPHVVVSGTIVAAAIVQAGIMRFRRSVSGRPRAPLCGMGICMECRATVDGLEHSRTCQLICRDGMDIRTDE